MIWNQLRSLIIAFPYEGERDVLSMKRAIEEHLEPGMKSTILLLSKKELKPEFKPVIEGVTYVSEKQLNVLKRKRNEDFETLLERPIDALFLCGTVSKRFERKLKSLSATVKIGLNSMNTLPKINLTSKSSEPIEMVNFAKNMLLKISNQ